LKLFAASQNLLLSIHKMVLWRHNL